MMIGRSIALRCSWAFSLRRVATVYSVLGVLLSRQLVLAQTAPAPPANTPVTLPPMVVTATRGGERPAEDLPVSTTVITEQDLKASPATTIDDVLRTVPGIQMPLGSSYYTFPTIPSVSMRGLGLGDTATRTLVLLDGIPMNGPFFGNVYWNRVPKYNLDRIEVVRGASSSLFGSYAMGGVINILTRPPTNTPQAVVEGRYGTDNTYQVNGFVSAPLADHLSASLNVDQFDTDGYFEVPPHQRGPIDRKTLADAQTLQGQVMYHPLPDLHLSIRGNYYNSDQPRNTKLSKTSTEVWYITSGLRYDLNPGSTLSADFFYGDETFRTDNTTSVPFGSRLSEFVSNAHRTPSDDVGGSLRWSKAFGRILQDLTVGVDVRRISGKDDADIFNEEGDFILRRIGKGEQLWVGGFGEVSYFPLPRFEVLASVRQDYFKNYSGSERENEVITKFKDRDFNETNYRLALRYALTDQVALRGAGYSGFRAPTLAELYRTFGTATFIGRSNANLKPETLNGGEVGLDLDVAACGFTGQITGFYNSVENFVGSVVVLEEPFTLQNTNLGRIRSRGVEITGTQQLWERVWLTMSYTFTDSTVVKDSELKGNWVEGTPRHFIGGNLTYRAPFGLTVEVRGRYLSRQFQDISNETKLGPHAVFDVSASYAVNSQVDLFFIGENIFDRDYAADNLGGVTLRGVPLQVFGGVRFKLG